MPKALVTGSAGLIGSACVRILASQGWDVIGFDNDMRQTFFGPEASTAPVLESLLREVPRYRHFEVDIRKRQMIREVISTERPEFIVHTAAQPSHEKAASIPYDDFDVNAGGTLNLLVAARDYCRDSPFAFISTNKVYGDRPNTLPMVELETRYDYAALDGVDESMSIDNCLHSLFGASKLAADVLCQEFGRYFDMPVGVFRGGCLTGPQHAAVELHGYLAYIVNRAVQGKLYTVYGHKGKQVRDQLHSTDVARLMIEFYRHPRRGEVYNMGGGRANSTSILETIAVLRALGFDLPYETSESARVGDHICYISDLGKIKKHFPGWRIEYDLERMIVEIVDHARERHGIG